MNNISAFESYCNFAELLGSYDIYDNILAEEGFTSSVMSGFKNFGSMLRKAVRELWSKFTGLLSNIMKSIRQKISIFRSNKASEPEPADLQRTIDDKEKELSELKRIIATQEEELSEKASSLKELNDKIMQLEQQNQKTNTEKRIIETARKDLSSQYVEIERELALTKDNLNNVSKDLNYAKKKLETSTPTEPIYLNGNSVKYSSKESEEYYQLVDDADTELRSILNISKSVYSKILSLVGEDDDRIKNALTLTDRQRRVSSIDQGARLYKQTATFRNALDRINEIKGAKYQLSEAHIKSLQSVVTGSTEYYKDLEYIKNKLDAIASNFEKSTNSVNTTGKKLIIEAVNSALADFAEIQKMYLELLSCLL
jgi:predicted nuclease with TOPRIM domain